MKQILSIAQVLLSVILIGLILLQQRGTGLSQVFGGSTGGYHTKRGLEKIIFIGTIVSALLFFGIAIASLLLASN